jgi:8-oxo-dGTP pyrophosphatase MutT (NUDIX family)
MHSWIEEVKRRLSTPAPSRLPPSEARQAAILVPLYVDAGQLWTVLTKRSDQLPHHRSQIAFPGGARETGEDAWTTALRETEEELGLESNRILRLGQLDEAWTPSGYHIVPCVAAVPFPLELDPNREEIAETFSVPVLEFANPRLVEEREVVINGTERVLRSYHVAGRQVWGVTARVLQNLMERLGFETPTESEVDEPTN